MKPYFTPLFDGARFHHANEETRQTLAHEYLKAQAQKHMASVGHEVSVSRYGQRPVEGLLMRVAPTGLVIAGHGVVPIYEVEDVDRR